MEGAKEEQSTVDPYDASSIQVLEGLEPVRKRPGMYIGSTGQRGLHHLLYEVLDNAIDEVQGGHASVIDVDLDVDEGWVTITDDGRGIPTSVHPRTGKSALETVLTVLHAGGKFGGESSGYSVSGGLHGVGVSVVNALSQYLEVKVWRNGIEYYQCFSQGAPLMAMREAALPEEYVSWRGTQIRFLYDSTIFNSGATFDAEVIRLRLRELAFLNASACILYRPRSSGKSRKASKTPPVIPAPPFDATTSANGKAAFNGSGSDHRAGNGNGTTLFEGSSSLACMCPWRPGQPLPETALEHKTSRGGTLGVGSPTTLNTQRVEGATASLADTGNEDGGLEGGSLKEGKGEQGGAEGAEGKEEKASSSSSGVSVGDAGEESGIREGETVEGSLASTSSRVGQSSVGDAVGAGVNRNGSTRGAKGRRNAASSSSSSKVRGLAVADVHGNGVGEGRGGLAGSMESMDGVVVADGWQVYHYRGGLQEFVAWMNQAKTALHAPIYLTKITDGVFVEVVLQWCSDAFSDTLVGFANSIRTIDGGTHMDGLKTALTRTINNLGKRFKVVKENDPPLQGDHIREGLSAIVSVKVPNPEFEGQTKTRLGNPEVRKIVDGAVNQLVAEWLETNPAALNAIVSKALMAARAADAAKKARELVRRKNVLTRSTLPGKLADCTSSNHAETEIFVVEGDSAGGSAKQARDRRTQAILPLRGKILNVERKDDSVILKNNEIANLIVALGLGAKGEGIAGLRYSRVVVLTDADVDGAHIRTLLLTFLFRYCRELFEKGHVFVAVPPLYKVESGRNKLTWCFSEEDLKEATSGMAPGSFSIQRFKGLGEMQPDQLWDTTLNPQSRLLRRLTIQDAAAASHMLTLLMGEKVAPRRQLIEDYSNSYALEDLDV